MDKNGLNVEIWLGSNQDKIIFIYITFTASEKYRKMFQF